MLTSKYYFDKTLTKHFSTNIYLFKEQNSKTKLGCGRYSRLMKKTLANCERHKKTADLVTFTEEILSGKLHFYAVLVNIHCSISSIPRPISLRNHNAADQKIAMDKRANKATSENLKFSFLEDNKVQ